MIYSPVVSLKSNAVLSADGTYIMTCDLENDHLKISFVMYLRS